MAFTFNTTQPAAAPGNLFGAPAQNAAAPAKSLFGNLPTSTTQQQQPAATGGMFGAQPAAPANNSFSFGGPNQGNKQPFATPANAAFGASQAQPQQGGLFGNTSAAPAAGLFGGASAQPQAQTGGLFGNNSTNQPAQGTTSLFGNTNQQQNQPQNSLFGSTNQQQQPNPLFGSTNQPQQQNNTFSFNNSQSQPAQNQMSNSLFGSTSGMQNGLGNSMAGGSKRPEVDIGERMTSVRKAWDPQSPDCRFKYFFYNVVEPNQAQQYGRPPTANDDAKWTRAVRENPDPTCMVPVLATGWEDVKKRSHMQQQIASVHQQKIKELSQGLTTLSRQANLTTSIRLSSLQTHLTQLQHRLIRLAAQSPAFIPSLQSTALRPEEIETKKTLESVKSDLDGKKGSAVGQVKAYGAGLGSGSSTPKKGGGARMIGQVNELWGQVEEIRRHRGTRQGGGEKDGWLSDERVLGEVAEVLSTQQMALQKLNDLATNAVFDADVMRISLGLASPHERNAS